LRADHEELEEILTKAVAVEEEDIARAVAVEEEESEVEERMSDEEVAYLAYMENQKRFLTGKLGANFGPFGGFNLGGGLGPGQTGLGAGLQLGPLGFKLGGGLGLQQSGLGAGLQLGPLGLGASTGLGNGGLGFNANAGLGNNFLGYGNHFSKYRELKDQETESKKKEAYQAYMENQKKLLSGKFGANFGSLGGFNLGGGLGPGQTGLGAGLQLGPLGFKLGGGLGLQQTGLGAGVQLGPFGLGASTGFGNGQFGFNGNAGLGNNFLGHANTYTPAVYANQYYKQVKSVVPRHSNRFLPPISAGFGTNFGSLGAGAGAGYTNGQLGFSGGLGLGNFLPYGVRPYYRPSVYAIKQ
jgi:hypothetical protein